MAHHIIDELSSPVKIAQDLARKRLSRAECPKCHSREIIITRDGKGITVCACTKCPFQWNLNGRIKRGKK